MWKAKLKHNWFWQGCFFFLPQQRLELEEIKKRLQKRTFSKSNSSFYEAVLNQPTILWLCQATLFSANKRFVLNSIILPIFAKVKEKKNMKLCYNSMILFRKYFCRYIAAVSSRVIIKTPLWLWRHEKSEIEEMFHVGYIDVCIFVAFERFSISTFPKFLQITSYSN